MEGTPWDLRLVYTHIYTHIHLYIHVFIHIHICSYTFSSTLIYIHTHLVFHYVFCRVNRWTLHQWMCPLYSHLIICWVPRPSILSLFCGCSLLLPVVWPRDLPPSPPDGVWGHTLVWVLSPQTWMRQTFPGFVHPITVAAGPYP